MRPSDLRFLLAWLLPLLTLYSIAHAPAQAAFWTFAVWGGIALLDALLPGGKTSPAALAADNSRLAWFQWLLRLYVLLQLALITLGAYAAVQSDWPTVLGLAFSVGFITGSQGITFAHELGHSKSKLDRFCAWVLMSSVCYGHFMVEHYRGHHPRAATQEDPASARRGESLYRFLPRTLWGSLASGWQLEAQRIAQFKSTWLRSPLAWSTAAFLMLFVLPALYLPAQTAIKFIAFFALQSVVAFLLLEVVNYIEHYGLRRNSEGGRREAFGLNHAWNADHVLSNALLANQRHSDHHMHAWKPYPTLAALPGPQLPTGYAGCLMLAMLPPLWFALMHQRLDALSPGATAALWTP
ncbi:MAG: alkane 1-monooxygenase [Polaromonas sp.]|uniref:alkane 1-monooxygenase n=1 Tax=Polaromonas sp. TaxID=1869339 RepID=UPI00273389A5|nr:alkane 1-monooxygenase [Polaromonas sp.]MDP2819449.1 alkane 1-monooxygenase [Polaromonas sp.]